MPELPEVETVRRIVEPQVAGKRILSAEIRNPKVVAYPEAEALVRLLPGHRISAMNRRGKYLSFLRDKGDRLFLHLRMTGQLLVTPADYPEENHTHLILHLSDGNEVRYVDQRRFGRFWFIRSEESPAPTGIAELGPEPFDVSLTADYLKKAIGSKKKPVKAILLDQHIVAGIGNIYSDEILFASHIHPAAQCTTLRDEDWEALAAQIPATMTWAIEKNQITAVEYLEGKGKEYRNTPYLRVYGRAGQPCINCGTRLEKTTIAGRSSCFCPVCQKEKRC